MEPRSTLRVVPPSKTFRPRNGQRQFLTAYQQAEPPGTCVGQCPTGYGKTIIAAMVFCELFKAGRADRMLFVVAGDQQAEQARLDFAQDCELIGLAGVTCWEHGNTGNSTLRNKRGDTNVFIVTVQTLCAAYGARKNNGGVNPVQQLLESGGKWFLFCDEFQHYAEGARWGEAVQGAKKHAAHTLALSATPYNRQASTVFGRPDIRVTYEDALEEKAVKPFELKAARYAVTFEELDGSRQDMTTCEIREQDVDDAFVRRKQLRVSDQYITPLLRRAVNSLVNKRAAVCEPGVRLQMLVRVHACYMAERIAKTLRDIVPDGYEVDWVGTGDFGRKDEDNRKVLAKFVPRKDKTGRRGVPTLDILVQVGMCIEGADTVMVSDLVDLSLSTYTDPAVTDRQFTGRGARTICVNGTIVPVTATLWVPSDNPIASFHGEKEFRKWLDSGLAAPAASEFDPDADELDEFTGGELVIDKRLIRVREVTLEEILEGDHVGRFMEDVKVSGIKLDGRAIDLDDPDHRAWAVELFQKTYRIANAERDAQTELRENIKKLDEQVGRYAAKMITLLANLSIPAGRKVNWFGVVKPAIYQQLARRTGYYRDGITTVEHVAVQLDALEEMANEFNRERVVPDWLMRYDRMLEVLAA